MKAYADATDEQVVENYVAACDVEVELHGRGEEVPSLVASTADAWMREGMRRGLL